MKTLGLIASALMASCVIVGLVHLAYKAAFWFFFLTEDHPIEQHLLP